MSEQNLIPDEGNEGMTEDQVLQFTQSKRKLIVDAVMINGQVPADNKERYVLLMALSDMDKQAVNIKKIGAKERSGEADRQAAMVIARMNTQLDGRDPFKRQPIEGSFTRVSAPVLDDSSLPALELAPGETEIGISHENYDSFIARVEGKEEA